MITSINRAWAFRPGIVTITSTDTLTQCLVQNYLISQFSVIEELNKGAFQFVFGDLVALSASDTSSILKFNGSDFSTLKTTDVGELKSSFLITSATSGSTLIPSGTTALYYELCGAGGGGGGAVDGGDTAVFAAGGGGGAGGFSRGYIFDDPTDFNLTGPINFTVGAPGTGGVGSASGGNGGVSNLSIPSAGSFSAIAAGGTGGAGSIGVEDDEFRFITGGVGGGASSNITMGGGDGFVGTIMSGFVASGAGGSSFVGNGGGQVLFTSDGKIGNGLGAGGSGAVRSATGTSTGGPGNPGMLFLVFYTSITS